MRQIQHFWIFLSITLLLYHLLKRWFTSWIAGQNVQKLQILLFFASYIARIDNFSKKQLYWAIPFFLIIWCIPIKVKTNIVFIKFFYTKQQDCQEFIIESYLCNYYYIRILLIGNSCLKSVNVDPLLIWFKLNSSKRRQVLH